MTPSPLPRLISYPSVVRFLWLAIKISLTIKLYKFFILGKLNIGSGMVLGYFSSIFQASGYAPRGL